MMHNKETYEKATVYIEDERLCEKDLSNDFIHDQSSSRGGKSGEKSHAPPPYDYFRS